MPQRIWTISTVLSLSRIVLLAPFAYFLFSNLPDKRLWMTAMIAAAALTDLLDGYLARKLHQVTEIGKIIDPLADKICGGGAAALLVSVGDLELWYVAVVIARDLLILLGGLYIKEKKRIISQSNWPGKIAALLIAVTLLLSALRIESIEVLRIFVLWTSLAMMLISLVYYAQRLFTGSSVGKGMVA